MATQYCAAAMAFLGFTVSLIIGLYVDNPFVTVVRRSVVILFVFYILGAILSLIGQRVIKENFEAEKERLYHQALNEQGDVVDVDMDGAVETKQQDEQDVPQQPQPAVPEAELS